MPSALAEALRGRAVRVGLDVVERKSRLYVSEVCVADGGEGVVAVHRVDCLGELRTARLVDAAGVDPDPLVAVLLGELAAPPNLVTDDVTGNLPGQGASLPQLLQLLERLLRGTPDMGKDRVSLAHVLRSREEMEFCPVCAEKPHVERP